MDNRTTLCKACGAELPLGHDRCPNCNALRDGLKFCQHCGQPIDKDCVVCPKCGKQVAQLHQEQPQIVINNANNNTNTNVNQIGGYGRPKNKWVTFFLCLFLGFFGAHKFYEGKIGMGVLYLFTLGIFGIGWLVDLIATLFKPVIYFV